MPTSPTQSDTSLTDNTTCACPNCECKITEENAFVVTNVAFCCEFCAEGHPNGEPCQTEECTCGEQSQKINK